MENYTLVATAVLVLLMSSASSAEVRYTITELPPPPGATWAEVTGINDHGQVAGFAYYPSQTTRPLTWEEGVPRLIAGTEDWYSGYAGGINTHGHVAVGWWDGQSHRSLVLTKPGGEHVLRPPSPPTLGRVRGLNDDDHAVGYMTDDVPGMTRAVLWRSRALIDLGISGELGTEAYDIDNADRIVGVRVSDRIARPFRWHHGLLVWLDSLHAGHDAAAVALNNHGHAVGGAVASDGSNRAVLWSGAVAIDLGTLLGKRSSNASDINDAGQIVGTAFGDGASAVLWQDGQIQDLNDFVASDSAWHLNAATWINNEGQIVGAGVFEDRAATFLLTPVPEPTLALGMALLTMVSLCRGTRR